MANERVLIVDDSPEIVDFVSEYVLKPNDYQVLVASDGEAGLNIALDQQPDLILLDMNMPKMTGMELLEALSTRKVNIPVIIMTSHGSETLAVQTFRMGVKDYILKPFQAGELLDAIAGALTEVRLRQERDEFVQRMISTNQQLEQRVKELNTLFGIGKSVTSLLDQDKLLSRLVEAAIFLTGAEEGALLLIDRQTEELYMVAARGIDERVVRSFRLKVDDSLAGEVINSGQPLILSGQDVTKIKTSYLVRSLMYVPLKFKGLVSGILTVDNRLQERDFTNHDLRLLSALADYAALSLENARLFNQVEGERTKLATILSEIEEPVVVVAGQENAVVVANSAFRDVFSLNAAFVEGVPLASVLHNPAFLKFLAHGPESGKGQNSEILLSDGRIFYTTLTPIAGVGRAVIMQDITHFKALDRMKSDFVATVSHDLGAPLTSIKDYAEMLGSAGELNEQQALFLERISTGLEQITALTDNLLDLSTIEAGVDPDLVVVDLGALATNLVASFQGQAGRKRQQLTCHTAEGRPALVLGNQLRLEQVISNLVDNAIKYTPEAGQISAFVQAEEKYVSFKVEDDGSGIPPAELPFVFDKFYRVQDKSRLEVGGTGLGLAICRSIIDKYGGSIWAVSHPEQGSTFTFTLPLAPPDEVNVSDASRLRVEAIAS
jgi:two-component system NtrC family sensor kinase